MMEIVKFEDLGLIDYDKAWKYQENKFQELICAKSTNQLAEFNNYLLFCEHLNVYTIGKSGSISNLLVNPDFLEKIEATVFRIDRGGDITYHGPGQIVGYPILDIEKLKISVKEYVFKLEQVIINTLTEYSIKSQRLDGAIGVWINSENQKTINKICAIGIKASRHITMHGFALNVDTNLDYFKYINPCGFVDKGVTSLTQELGKQVEKTELKDRLKKNFSEVFEILFY